MSSSSSIPSEHHSTDDKPSPALDWRSIAGGAGAASIVAYASSRLGVAGTIMGAAIMSIVAAVTSTYIARAAHQTERQVRKVTQQMSAAASAHAPTAAERHTAEPDVALPHPEPVPTPETSDSEAEPETNGWVWPWRRMAILAGVLFAATIAVVYFVGIASNAEQPLAPRESAPQPAATDQTDQQPAPTDDGPTPSPSASTTSTATPSPTSTATTTRTPTEPPGTPSPTSGG
jgi:hypothetical protein